jgi:hypothetical protein
VEVRAEPLHRGPSPARPLVGQASDQHHEHRDERHRHDQDDGGPEVGDHDPQPGGDRHDGREAQRGEVAADPRLQGIDAGGRQGGYLARVRASATGLVERVELGDHVAGHLSPGRCGRRGGGQVGRPACGSAHRADRDERYRK